MLKRLGPSVTTTGEATSVALFPSKLEFNPPAHGVWNIVHVGMLVPEAHQIYVCAVNCMRGVVLTASEMGASERFSCVVLKESDIVRGTVEQVTLEGIADVLHKLEARDALPPCVIVFPVCTHHFLGVSMARVYRELRHEFPGVDFVEAYMDPIMKRRLSPDARLRKAMFDPLEPCEADNRLVALLGGDFAIDADCELRDVLKGCGYSLAEVQDCKTYAEFKGLARAVMLICTYPGAQYGVEKLARRLGRRYLYLPSSFDYEEIARQYVMLRDMLGGDDLPIDVPFSNVASPTTSVTGPNVTGPCPESPDARTDASGSRMPCTVRQGSCGEVSCSCMSVHRISAADSQTDVFDKSAEVARCEEELAKTFDAVGDAPIAIDASAHPRPLGLARLLVEHGFNVREVYLDAVTDEDAPALTWLQTHAPEVQLSSIVLPELRIASRERPERTLAIGQKAAWFCGTQHFVNIVEGAGLWGYAGIRAMARLMREAWATPKDTRDLVPRKGLGCASCF